MSSVVISGNTSGTITLDAPAVSGTTTLTLPTTNGTVLTNGTNANFPAGSVLQVVNATTTTQTTSNITSYADTSLSASITPTSSANKILIIASFVLYPANVGGAAAVVGLNRGATLIFDQAGYNNVGSSQITSAFNYLDSPSTTSSTTYTCRLKSSIASNLVAFGLTGYSNVITLMEIKG